MINVNYGYIRINLAKIMKEQDVSINKLAFRAEMQRTQLKKYMKGDIQRMDMDVLARLCYALECSLEELIEYVPAAKLPDKE